MKDINAYIIEKLKLDKDIVIHDSDLDKAYDYLVNLFDKEEVHYTIDVYDSPAASDAEKFIKVIITDKDLLDKKKADRYVGNINTTLIANNIKYRGLYPTINKQGNRKTSITILFYKRNDKH